MFDLLQRLCETAAPSGCESSLARLIEKEIHPFVDEITFLCYTFGNHQTAEGKS